MTILLGLLLLVLGAAGLLTWGRERRGAPRAGWYPDPTTTAARRRWWDGGTWSERTAPGGPGAGRGRRFRGRFWSLQWLLPALAAVAVVVVGGMLWTRTRDDEVLVALSVLAEVLVCVTVYRFVARQLALDEVVRGRVAAAAAVAGAGATMVVAGPLDAAVARLLGVVGAFGLSGPVEELTKLLVPLGVYALGRLRSPRAGIVLGLASGFGFGVAEAALYAVDVPLGASPNPCTGARQVPGVAADLQEQIVRVAFVEPMHWLWTGFAVAVIWRAWHRTGPRASVPVVGAVLLVMAWHSLNDSSLALDCGRPGYAALRGLAVYVLPVLLYLVFRAAARRSLPPALVGEVSRGWHPRRLPTVVVPPTDPTDPAGAVPAPRSDAAGRPEGTPTPPRA